MVARNMAPRQIIMLCILVHSAHLHVHGPTEMHATPMNVRSVAAGTADAYVHTEDA